MKTLFLSLIAISSLFAANDFYYEYGKKIEIVKKNTIQTASYTSNETDILNYTTTEGKEISFKNQIIVKCKENAYCDDDLENLNIQNFKKARNGFFLVYVQENEDIFDLMQKLHEKEDILSAHPNYIVKKSIK